MMKCRWPFLVAAALAIWFALSIAFMWPPIVCEARRPTGGNACVNNLRIIDSAKEQWAAAHGRTNGDPIVVQEVNEYIKGNTTPTCPDGGTYAYNAVAADPTCSLGQIESKRVRVTLFSWMESPSGSHKFSTK
jgi:hypothetical protein